MFRNVFKSGIRAAYNVSDTATFHTECWAVYPAKHKQTGRIVSVFIFDKTQFESLVNRICAQSPNTKNPKLITAECFSLVKAGVSNLAKHKHPQILTVIESLEETKLKFIFVSEPVVGNLQTVKLDEGSTLEIQKGILELSKGLQFLHNVCGMIHMNIQPTSIMINSLGDWKLSSFYFLQSLDTVDPDGRENFSIMNMSSVVPFANLNFSFVAPELIIDSTGLRLSPANDIWSLAQLIFYLHNDGECPISCFDANSVNEYKQVFRKFEQKFYNHRLSELRYIFKNIPEGLWQILTQMLARYPNDRLTINQFIDSDYFERSLIKTMWFIDEFGTKTLGEKIIFLDGILESTGILADLPSSFKHNKLLPLLVDCITTELASTTTKPLCEEVNAFTSKAFTLVLMIGESLSKLSFQDRIFKPLLTVIRSKKVTKSPLELMAASSVKNRLVIVDNLAILKQKLNSKDLAAVWKALLTFSLTYMPVEGDSQADQIRLQDSYLGSLDKVIEIFDFSYIKNDLLPLICLVFKTTTVLSTKLSTIETFKLLVTRKLIDQGTIVEVILPVFENLKSRDNRIIRSVISYFVVQIESDIIKQLDISVERLLSQCLRLAFACENCTQSEFQDFMKTIKSMENTLAQKRLDELPSKAKPAAETEGPVSFDSLINSALIKGQSETGEVPKHTIMKPTRDFSKSMNEESKSFESRPQAIVNNTGASAKPLNLGNRTPLARTNNHDYSITLNGQNQGMKGSSFGSTNRNLDNINLLQDRTRGPSNSASNTKIPPGFSNTTLVPSLVTKSKENSEVDLI
ncbi:hypothetical protein C7M61_003039 [Candidozyma pseudohaemuli]|uniref:Protein kinase domain-containing protein n=1 Tax=Candidozyma pseudohaemuli TaxID=418784 RepID=A0A2P7YP96_9ASCO|nr:hypothetical protein C7M61_003039 [[Candida] pseudohaemulonii]PSK37794.1 hypothetical protein C7M61_003039 [[Candida] pseudohaemulonii]